MRFIKTSLPFTFSTMAASLMGAVDTAVVGHLGNYTYINAVSLGAVIFSTVYWLFGFLKISTSGFAAQAMGHHDPKLLMRCFYPRSVGSLRHRPAARNFTGAYLADSITALQSRRSN